MRSLYTAAALTLISAVLAVGGSSYQTAQPVFAQGDGGPAPVLGLDNPNIVPGEYIVVMHDTVTTENRDATIQSLTGTQAAADTNNLTRFDTAVNGFAGSLSDLALAELQADPNVAFIEADATVSIDDTWGQDRVDQRNLPLDGGFTASGNGSGVHVYIIDTGMRVTHNDFSGRVGAGFDAVGGGVDDCNGHGTHVAGSTGGSTYGVAPAVTLHPVRVLDCQGSGTNAGVIAGIDWVATNHASSSVANMSLGGGASAALDGAVNSAINSGVTMVVAAGNSNADACTASPARVPAAITVGASTISDARAGFSNWGTCLDLFAPGADIPSAWNSSDSATNTISGTSMASPHVAGAAAIYLQENSGSSPAAVATGLANNATSGVLSGIGGGSPNLLLYVGTGSEPPPPGGEACSNSESFSGALTGTGTSSVEPGGTHYFSGSGTHTGCLAGPAGTDFDLYLQVWNSGWNTVASGTSNASTENVTYSGAAGDYRWVVHAYSGAGAYEFGLDRP